MTMRPKMPRTVTVLNPGPPAAHPVTGNPIPGPPRSVTTRAYLAQRPVENLSSATELTAAQATSIGLFTLLVPPPPEVALSAASVVVDEDGYRYHVDGDPAIRRDAFGRRAVYQAAALRRVSDLQEA